MITRLPVLDPDPASPFPRDYATMLASHSPFKAVA